MKVLKARNEGEDQNSRIKQLISFKGEEWECDKTKKKKNKQNGHASNWNSEYMY